MAAGCHVLHPVPTVPILVQDAETKAPIPGAEVQLWTPADNSTGKQEPSGITGPDGVARIKAEFRKESDVLIHVTAPGYLPDDIDHIQAVKLPGAPAGGALIELFAGPRPVVELVVPSDFRGDVKVEVKVPEDARPQVGQRAFRYRLPTVTPASYGTTPVVRVEGPPLFERGLGPEFRGLYADGTPMPAEPKDTDVVLRWVRSAGADQYFVVGTKIDQESARRAAEKNIGPPEPARKASSGGGGGGGGGRGGPRGGGGGGGGSGGMNGPNGW
jgi:uncharacterized membrane protein YgcG